MSSVTYFILALPHINVCNFYACEWRRELGIELPCLYLQCVLAGHWMVLEDVDSAPSDVVREVDVKYGNIYSNIYSVAL